MKMPSFKFIRASAIGASILTCKCGGIAIYQEPRPVASCFSCGRTMEHLKTVVPTAPERPVGRLVLLERESAQ